MLDKESFLKEISNRYNFRKSNQDKIPFTSHASEQLNKYQYKPKDNNHISNYEYEVRQNQESQNVTPKTYRNMSKKYKYDSKYQQQNLNEKAERCSEFEKQGLRRISRDVIQTHKENKRESQNLENIRLLEIERDQLKSTISEQSKDILRYQQEITQLNQYIQELKVKDEQNLNSLIQRLNKLDNLAIQSQTKILQVQSEARRKQDELNHIISNLNKQKQNLTAELQSLKQQYERQNIILRQQIQKKQLENFYIQKLNEQELNKRNQRIELYEKMIQQKKTEDSEIICIIRILQNQKQEETKKFIDLNEKFKILEKEVLTFQKNKNTAYQNLINNLQNEKNNTNNNNQQFEDLLSNKQSQIKTLQFQLQQVTQMNHKLKAQIKQYVQKYLKSEKQLTQKLQAHEMTIKNNFKYEFQNLLAQEKRKYHLLSQEYEITKKQLRRKQIESFELKDKLQKTRKLMQQYS